MADSNSGAALVLTKLPKAESHAMSVQDIFISLPLYAPIAVTVVQCSDLRRNWMGFDAYCVSCAKETPFATKRRTVVTGVALETSLDGSFSVEINCNRCGDGYLAYFRLQTMMLEKVGQYPSIADITGGELIRYRSVLRDGYFSELTRANGLISHGVGIGAFVYLRRIFEKLIEDHRKEFEANNEPIGDWHKLRMEEKIGSLSSVLPDALVKNKATYSILSVGIHTLGEKECKLYYPAIKAAILQILEQDVEARNKEDAAKEVERSIQEIALALKASKSSEEAR